MNFWTMNLISTNWKHFSNKKILFYFFALLMIFRVNDTAKLEVTFYNINGIRSAKWRLQLIK